MKISNSVYTKQEADELLMEIEEVERSLFRLGRRPSFSPQLSRLAQGQGLESVKKALTEALVLELTVAVKLSPVFLAKIGRWLREEVSPKAILDIKVDPSIIAGAVVSFEGHYKDLSVKKKLSGWFEKEKDEIFRILS